MSRNYRKFTAEDDKFIIENQSKMVNSAMAEVLKRTTECVGHRVALLHRKGLLITVKNWKPPFRADEKQFLQDNFWTLGAKECARKLGRPYITVLYNGKRLGLEQNPELQFNNQDISHFLTPVDPFVVYFLGYFWADGTVRGNKPRMVFKIKRDDFADIRSLIPRLGDMWHYRECTDSKHPNWSVLSMLDVQHRGLWKFLCDHDYRIKSGASADKILQHIPESLRHYWWRGYFDGDGSMSILHDGKLSFNSGMDQDWTFVHNIGKMLDIDFIIERKDRGNRAGSKAIISTWNYLKRLIEYMYQGEQFGLLRKKKRCEVYLNSNRAKKPNLTSIYRGVSWNKILNKFTMQVSCDGVYYSQRFVNEEEAARAYDLKARELFGNKAIVNFAA